MEASKTGPECFALVPAMQARRSAAVNKAVILPACSNHISKS